MNQSELLDSACNEIEILKGQVRRAYSQRANLAVAFAKMIGAQGGAYGRGIDDKEGNDMEWRHVLYFELPTGEQISYHFAPDDVQLLDGLPTYRKEWDGKFTGTTEWHELVDAPKACTLEAQPIEQAAALALEGFAWKRWLVERARLNADKDVSEEDRERILRGYIKAWSKR